MKLIRQSVALVVTGCIGLMTVSDGFGYQSTAPNPQAEKQTPQQLDDLVAPIALYPDSLVAQILSAATYPDEVLEAAAIAVCHDFITQGKREDNASADLVVRIANSSGRPVMFRGYYFRVPGSGSTVALVAYPAEYRSSGVMTFVVTPNGKVFERDLGATTAVTAAGLKALHESGKWRAAED